MKLSLLTAYGVELTAPPFGVADHVAVAQMAICYR